jgi:glycosyl hydrolase family 64 (putative beta-1,3-glucanase)
MEPGYKTNNINRALIPFTIINKSGSSKAAYLYAIGKVLGSPDKEYWLSDFKGNCTQFQPSQPAQSYGLLLQDKETSAMFPQLDAVRIYISFEQPLKVPTSPAGISVAVSADNPAPGNPNYYTPWDFVEGTWHDYGTFNVLHLNTTQVDSFGLALKIEHSGGDPTKPTPPRPQITITNGFDDTDKVKARSSIFADLKSAGKPWSDLIIYNAGNPIRALMPLKAMNPAVISPPFPNTQLDGYVKRIAQTYDLEAARGMSFLRDGVRYVGHFYRSRGQFVFEPDQELDINNNPTSRYVLPIPTTTQCYANTLETIASPVDKNFNKITDPSTAITDTRNALFGALSATLLRTTLARWADFPVPQDGRKEYYVQPPVCEYARIIHKYGINNHAFCYGLDEVAGDAGGNRDVWSPTSMKLTIMAL